VTPYYERGGVTIYHGDCRDVLPHLDADFVLTDPPYGIAVRTDRASRKRAALAACNDFPPVYGDNEPFDRAPLLRFPKIVLFGANYYAERLPASACWLVWDKLDGLSSKREVGFNDQADVELAWTNLDGQARILRDRWIGAMKGSERADRRLHPTQKPVTLMQRILSLYAHPSDVILDPYIGSGSVIVAARNTNRRAIGIEIEERYCEIAARRLSQDVLPLEFSA
jgi:site-specific DNA-methyltransferase (adenine-specific)